MKYGFSAHSLNRLGYKSDGLSMGENLFIVDFRGTDIKVELEPEIFFILVKRVLESNQKTRR